MPCSVLIVDDNPRVRRSVRNLVERSLGYEISGEAENGLVAVQKVEEFRPDIVLLDYQMPEMNGLEAAAQIKRIAPDTKIVMLTMHASVHMTESATSAGVDEVIAKNGALSELVAAIRNACLKDS